MIDARARVVAAYDRLANEIEAERVRLLYRCDTARGPRQEER